MRRPIITVLVESHSPMALSARARVPWEDVWLSWSFLTRERKRAAPLVVGWSDVLSDLRLSREILKDPEHAAQAKAEGWYKEQMAAADRARRAFRRGAESYVWDGDAGLVIFCSALVLSRATVNAALRHYVLAREGFPGVVGAPKVAFSWAAPQQVVIPISV